MNIPTVNIFAIQFAPLSDKENKKKSISPVDSADTNDGSHLETSLGSDKFGSNTYNVRCKTCNNTKNYCIGHSGHIELNCYCPNPIFASEIVKFLKVFCFKCGGVITGSFDRKFNKLVENLNSVLKKSFRCQNKISDKTCDALHPFVTENKANKSIFVAEYWEIKNKKQAQLVDRKELFPREIFEIFSRINPDDLIKLGVKINPTDFINKTCYVPPKSIRANIINIDDDKSTKNKINIKLNSILKKNGAFGEVAGEDFDELKYKTQIHELISEKVSFIEKDKTNNMQAETISKKISEKRGQIRGSVLGGRVFNCGRNFIGSTRFAKFNQLIIPQHIAEVLQTREVISDVNRDYLMQFVNSNKYPKCVKIIKKNGSQYKGKFIQTTKLENGDIVIRQMITGDTTIQCRHPSLLMSNIAGMKLVVSNDINMFLFNAIICILNGSDFDGDETTIFNTTRPEESFEIEQIAGIKELMVSNGRGTPVLGQVVDSVIGLALLTRDETILLKREVRQIFENLDVYPELIKNEYSGREVLTLLFQKCKIKINYSGKAKYFKKSHSPFRPYSKTEIEVIIKDGIFKSGIIDGEAVGSGTYGGINHKIYIKYGQEKCMDMVWYMQQIAIQFLFIRGFTMSLADYIVSKNSIEEIRKIEHASVAKSIYYSNLLSQGKIIPPSGKTTREWFELQQINILSGESKFDESILKGIDFENNNMYNSICFGAKGKEINFNEITAGCGQALIYGLRLAKEIRGRASPFYSRDSKDPRAYGFVFNSYMSGLTPSDIENISKTARKGLIDKCLATAKSGTLNRVAVASTGDLIVNNLRMTQYGTKIRQFLYGGDGMDPRMTFKAFLRSVFVDLKNYKDIEEEYKQLVADKELFIKLRLNHHLRTSESFTTPVYIPINFVSLCDEIIVDEPQKPPISVYKKIKKFIDEIPLLYTNNKELEFFKYSNIFFQMYLRFELCYKNLCDRGFSEKHIDLLLLKIKDSFLNSLEDPGSCVGHRASEGIIEIATQAVLKSIHGGGHDKAEIFKHTMYAKPIDTIKVPLMFIYFKPEFEEDENFVREFAFNMEMTKLKTFITKFQIFFENFGRIIHPAYKAENINCENHAKIFKPPSDLLPWCIRLELSLAMIINKNLSTEDIINELVVQFPYFYILYEDMKYIRIYIRQQFYKKIIPSSVNDILELKPEILNTVVRGLSNLNTITIEKATRDYPDKTKKIYYLLIEGYNPEILLFDAVDETRFRLNSQHEIYRICGITTSRNTTLDMLIDSLPGAYYSHYTVFADQICCTTVPYGLKLPGSKKRKSSAMTLIADSHWLVNIKRAAVLNKEDKVSGPNSALISGSVPQVGTFYNSLIINKEFLEKNQKKQEEDLEDI